MYILSVDVANSTENDSGEVKSDIEICVGNRRRRNFFLGVSVLTSKINLCHGFISVLVLI